MAANLLAWPFTPSAPNQVWGSDITSPWPDAGWPYLAIILDLFNREVVGWAFKPRLTADHMTCSMSRQGNCWDNAPTESWFNSFKNERIFGNRYATRAEVTAETFDFIEVFYNREPRHSSLGDQSPLPYLEH